VSVPAVLPELDRAGLARVFTEQLAGDVDLVLSLPPHPRDEAGMGTARRAEALLREFASLSPRLRLSSAPPPDLADLAEDTPVVVTLRGAALGGVHFAGPPAGYEVPILVNAILDVSRGETSLSPGSVKVLGDLANPVTLRLFTSASCASCATPARLAVQMALVSRHVDTWVLDAAQVPRLARRIGSTSLPAALINDICWVPGPQPELALLARVLFAGT
jgi:alkyl hydroperoxide reductase subunit AhpF